MPISGGLVDNVVRVFKTSGQDVESSTTLVDATNLSFPVKSGELWKISGTLFFDFSATGQVKVAINGPSVLFMQLWANMISDGVVPSSGTANAMNTGIDLVNAGATSGTVNIDGAFLPTADGTFTVQFAQVVSDSTATELSGGSFIEGIKSTFNP